MDLRMTDQNYDRISSEDFLLNTSSATSWERNMLFSKNQVPKLAFIICLNRELDPVLKVCIIFRTSLMANILPVHGCFCLPGMSNNIGSEIT